MRNRIFTFAVAAAVCMTAVSCHDATDLARNVQATWSANTQEVEVPSATSASVTPFITFVDDPAMLNGGNVTLSWAYSVTAAVAASNDADVSAQPVSLAVSGLASVNGTWKCVSGDRIDLDIDTSSLSIKTDPVADMTLADLPEGMDTAVTGDIHKGLADVVAAKIRPVLSRYYARNMTLEHVKIDEHRVPATLSFSRDGMDMSMTRQP